MSIVGSGTRRYTSLECKQGSKARNPYLEKMHRIQAVADKNGKRTGKYIADLIANNCFRHTGITCADPMAMDWAKSRPTASTAEETCTEQQEIHWCSGATSVHSEGKTRLGVFTDGSALATATDWLAHGGWGMFITAGSSMNAGGHLLGHPVTSYRAEVRAMVAAVVRARVPVCTSPTAVRR